MLSRLWSWIVPTSDGPIDARSLGLLAVLALALLVPGQIGVPAIDRDEARFTQATKQMLQSGDFIDIRLGDDPRYLQPIGIYWLQSIAAAPFGGEDAPIAAFRLPSLLSALGAILLTAWLGSRILGAGGGFAAGLLMAMSLLVAVESHFAKTDSALLLSTLVAQTALFFVVKKAGDGAVNFVGPPLIFWVAVGVAVLIKGPIPLLVIGFTVAAFALWSRRIDFFHALSPLKGLPIVVAIVAPWLVAIAFVTDGDFYRVAIGHSFGGKIAGAHDKHGAPPGYHLSLFMVTFFPGVLLAGLGAVRAFQERGDWRVKFLLCWIVPTYVMFELVGTKLPHYPLPTFPAIAILAAWGLMAAPGLLARAPGKWAHRASFVLFAIGGLIVAIIAGVAQNELFGAIQSSGYVAFVLGLGILAAGGFLALNPSLPRLLPLFGAVLLTYSLVFQIVIPGLSPMWVSSRAAADIDKLTGCEAIDVATAGYREPSNLFHFGKQTYLARDGAVGAEFLQSSGPCTVIMVDHSERELFDTAAHQLGLSVKSLGRIEGKNYVDNADLDLTYFALQSSPLKAGD